MPRSLRAILAAALWIACSEFFRNQVLLLPQWTAHYQRMGLVFPAAPVNGAVWGLWSLCFAIVIFVLSRRFTLAQTAALAWFTGFGLMWLVIGNLGVLPWGILPWAVPLSALEAGVAAWLCHRLG
ncbi:MAG TPA: hypothetical protein VMT93_10015 [Gemmatimonadaceae bacterium]|nr:hypothetical protein [Gemmatimonadaceae bacterium]